MKKLVVYYSEQAGWICDVCLGNSICASTQGMSPQDALAKAMPHYEE